VLKLQPNHQFDIEDGNMDRFLLLFFEHFAVIQLRRNQQKLNQIYIKYLKQLSTRKSSPKAFYLRHSNDFDRKMFKVLRIMFYTFG
jgi:hypothetical protein